MLAHGLKDRLSRQDPVLIGVAVVSFLLGLVVMLLARSKRRRDRHGQGGAAILQRSGDPKAGEEIIKAQEVEITQMQAFLRRRAAKSPPVAKTQIFCKDEFLGYSF